MNILIDRPPTELEIAGQVYPVNSDFRDCLKIILAFEDPELTALEKQSIMLYNLYPELPENIEAAIAMGTWFLNGGSVSSEDDDEEPRVFSFEKDSGFIFAAFQQTHRVDLEAVKDLHWWKFIALFMDLGADTTFCNLVSLRRKVKTGKATKEERAVAHDMGDMFDVEDLDTRSLEERMKERQFMELIKG